MQVGTKLSKNDKPQWHQGLTLPKRRTVQTLSPGGGGAGREGMVWSPA